MKTFASFSTFTVIAAGFALSACKQNFDILQVEPTAVTDKFAATGQPASNKVDVLFVMDSSHSIVDEKATVNQSIDDFIDRFAAKNVNYQLGLITTDGQSPDSHWHGSGSQYNSFRNGGFGTLLAYGTNELILKPSLNTSASPTKVQDQFKQNVNKLTVFGSGAEMALYSTVHFFDASRSTWNAGFVRDDAILSVVIVSDEDESAYPEANQSIPYASPHDGDTEYEPYVRAYPRMREQRVQEFVNTLRTAKKGRTGLIRVDAVTMPSTNNAGCTPEEENDVLGYGEVYSQVASLMGGKTINICQNFAAELGHLGTDIAGTIERRFALTQSRAPGTLMQVLVNGNEIAESATNGYSYSAVTNEIQLNGLDLTSLANIAVEVRYITPAKAF